MSNLENRHTIDGDSAEVGGKVFHAVRLDGEEDDVADYAKDVGE